MGLHTVLLLATFTRALFAFYFDQVSGKLQRSKRYVHVAMVKI